MRVYHTCGYPLWVETQTHEPKRSTVYRDDEEESPTSGEEVTRCPGCNKWLTDADLHAERSRGS